MHTAYLLLYTVRAHQHHHQKHQRIFWTQKRMNEFRDVFVCVCVSFCERNCMRHVIQCTGDMSAILHNEVNQWPGAVNEWTIGRHTHGHSAMRRRRWTLTFYAQYFIPSTVTLCDRIPNRIAPRCHRRCKENSIWKSSSMRNGMDGGRYDNMIWLSSVRITRVIIYVI